MIETVKRMAQSAQNQGWRLENGNVVLVVNNF